ncbi:MAG TPA: ABC transporter permease subunit [Terracidiphilus sp.]|nr:ABC transporter permease subunit [Terracidiphilus sp.]
MRIQHPFARSLVTVRTWPFFIDAGIAICALAVFFGLISTGVYWLGKPVPVVPISNSISALPLYAFYSIVRMIIAYMLSLAFAISYGYIAAYNPRLEPWMVAALDILQSIPVLSFLPPVVLAMVALIPSHQLGIELGVILLIFTGQVWNLAFSFYSSLKTIPREMIEASRIYRYSAWQRFWQLQLPFATIGLVWNSIVSVAGGWFALIACEMGPIGTHYFIQLPGLGSYLQTSSASGDIRAMVAGFAAIILIVVATDQLIWRPLIAWSDKFKFEQVESADRVKSPILEVLRRSAFFNSVPNRILNRIEEPIYRRLSHTRECQVVRPLDEKPQTKKTPVFWVLAVGVAAAVCWAAAQAVFMLSTITWPDLRLLLEGAAATFLRVNASLLISAAWTIPVGVAIGLNPRIARVVQPFAQIMASVPATAFFPILLIGLVSIGSGLGIGSVVLMLLGTQWYILFNVIAGAMSIPSDLREVASLYRFTRWQRWTKLILPGIFPYLITGMVTASGGAWNASVFAEYSHLKDRTLETIGLGAQIDAATESGRFAMLLLATILISLMVVTMNRLVWRRLYRLAETRFKLEG